MKNTACYIVTFFETDREIVLVFYMSCSREHKNIYNLLIRDASARNKDFRSKFVRFLKGQLEKQELGNRFSLETACT